MADEDKILDHNYDGIQEYDNKLPKWWLWLFYITIVFGIGYVYNYHIGSGLLPHAELAKGMDELAAMRKAHTPIVKEVTEESLLALLSDKSRLGVGQGVFMQKCTPCHGPGGGGIVGPNLTDDFWIHGGKLTDIRRTIQEGVPAKGMISWRGLMPDEDITNLALFIRSIRGTNPANPKVAEGTPFTP